MTGEAFLGLVMLVVLIGVIFIGFPISFTMLFLALAFGYFGIGKTVFDLAYFQTIGLMKEELLAAVPLFVLMGFITEQAGLMERLFRAFRDLLAPIRGSLFAVVILTSTVFAMATGIVGAAVTVLGIMASPMMIKSGYDARLSAGAITAGGTLGISDSAFGDADRDGAGARRVGGRALFGRLRSRVSCWPASISSICWGVRSSIRSLGPPVPKEERTHSVATIMWEVIVGVLPLALLITATLGSIIAGLATPTEAAAVGALGAFVLAAVYGRLTYAGIRQAVLSTTATSSMVLLLAVTSNIFGAVFSRLGTANWLTETMLALQVPPLLMLVIVLVLIFLLGWPFEWPAIILVFLPIFYPVVAALQPAIGQSLDISTDLVMVWFGAVVAVTLQTAYLSPPVAMSAYYLKQVVKEWSLATIYKGMFEFMILQCIAIVLVVVFPWIATSFPEQVRREHAATKVEKVDDSKNRLEEDPFEQYRRQSAPK